MRKTPVLAALIVAGALALVGLIDDALQLVEDVAALSNSLFNSPAGVGFFATAASYEPNAINRFYDGLHKRVGCANPSGWFERASSLG